MSATVCTCVRASVYTLLVVDPDCPAAVHSPDVIDPHLGPSWSGNDS